VAYSPPPKIQSPYPNPAKFGSISFVAVRGEITLGDVLPLGRTRGPHGCATSELPHPFVGGALFLAPWVTGKVPQLMHPPRKKKPGALLSSSHLHRRFKEGDLREASGQTVPLIDLKPVPIDCGSIGGITRYLDRATMTPKYGFGRLARWGALECGDVPVSTESMRE
jgi:hypothetical protein